MPNDLLDWLKQPFSPDMSATRWFLFIGLLIALLYAWHMVFRDIKLVEGAVT